MYRTFFKHQWKYFVRSQGFERNIITQILTILFAVYVIVGAFIIGNTLKVMLELQYGSDNMVTEFCRLILYYFSFDLIVRFLWQGLPTLTIQPYLIQNIKRKQLIFFLNVRSLFTFFNIIPFVLFLPFVFTVIAKLYGNMFGFIFTISLSSLFIGNHFWILFIKKQTTNSNFWMVGFFLFLLLFYTLSYFKIIGTDLLEGIINIRWLNIIPILYYVLGFYFNNKLLRNNFYFDNTSISAEKQNASKNSLLQKIIENGSFFDLDIKLILRNKRPRSMLMMSLLFLFYGLITFKTGIIDKGELALPLLGSILVIGLFSMNYSQFIFSWQSSYFDGLLTHNIIPKEYIKSKFRLIIICCSISFFLSSFYVFIDWRIILILLSAYLYCIGILPIISIYFGMYNYKKLDISKSSSFNYQGTGAPQWIYSFIFLLLGVIIYIPMYIYYSAWYGVIGIATIGFINLLLQNWWVTLLNNRLQKNKYKILSGFREN